MSRPSRSAPRWRAARSARPLSSSAALECAVLGALLIWFLWIKAEVWGPAGMSLLTSPLSDGPLRQHLIESAPQMRFVAMGLVLLLVLRFAPRGLLPER